MPDTDQHIHPCTCTSGTTEKSTANTELTHLNFFSILLGFARTVLVNEANRYAQQRTAANWIPVTLAEMHAFVGVMTAMGLVPLLAWKDLSFYAPEID